ncbi:2-oxoglutarate and iron-dependent oxygenase domain-containing protein [Streptomyces sp. NPDC050803]|uniref:2-oxoglutarate and iron-dependent oxygenase domain-containing protein n=1 Tax=unclassified Streptomyces TaxID=2593676 RepID=UPI00341ED9B8
MSDLSTFHLPDSVTGTTADAGLAQRMINAWQRDGIFQIATTARQDLLIGAAYEASRRFFALPPQVKARHVSDLSYGGYIASGEEVTDGVQDGSEIFTVTPDIPADDPRVRQSWPCHGPTPWPDEDYRRAMRAWMDELAGVGQRLLRLTALGLSLPLEALTRLTEAGWHHMRVLRFPAATATAERGIGAHTDYGLLVIAAQDPVGQALFVRPPVADERRNRNWLADESAAGLYEEDDRWLYVPPVPCTLTVFPGDIMQLVTRGALLSTPHKVRLADRERYALAYFHEPAFNAVARPFSSDCDGDACEHDELLHYGSHFTNMFMRCYPERITTRRIHDENRLAVLSGLRRDALGQLAQGI